MRIARVSLARLRDQPGSLAESSTNTNSASASMNRQINQAHAARSIWQCLRVAHPSDRLLHQRYELVDRALGEFALGWREVIASADPTEFAP